MTERSLPSVFRAETAFLLFAATVAIGCGGSGEPAAGTAATGAAAPATAAVRDAHSFARPDEVRVTHVALDLRADFIAKKLAGTATLDLERAGTASSVVLDTQDLTIEAVTDSGGRTLKHELGAPDKVLGRALTVELPEGVRQITIKYATSPSAAALQWLTPEQTAGKKHPYLFSQGQAILTRTWIPTQDSPGIRQTYSARITVPAALRAVMSAEHLTPDGRPAGSEKQFEFRMQQAIPPYLIALAIGDIAFRELGPRSGVFTEPSVLDRAAREFADVEKMIDAAERLGGPYRWGRYDILVLPPSFPFGGMENPRLTFATPTILAGDKSLTALIAHELAHSWSGNLVTNATWRDFWLNEGFTSYFERRIIEALYGPEQSVMLEVLGRRELSDEMKRLPPAETILHIDLAGRNPDDGMTAVAYDKGSAFAHVLELAAGRERFDAFMRGYFDRHAFTSLTTAQFADEVRTNLIAGDRALEERIRLDEWLYQPGLPSNAPVLESEALAAVDREVSRFTSGTPAASLTTMGWSTQQWQHFLGALPMSLSPAQLADLDRAFGFTRTGNSEVLFGWLRIAIRNRYQPAMAALERFLTEQGRRKFLRPLYEDLMATDWGKAEARRIYAKARPSYHPVSTSTLDTIVK
jgi:leukotriene-A4 hydrolase